MPACFLKSLLASYSSKSTISVISFQPSYLKYRKVGVFAQLRRVKKVHLCYVAENNNANVLIYNTIEQLTIC